MKKYKVYFHFLNKSVIDIDMIFDSNIENIFQSHEDPIVSLHDWIEDFTTYNEGHGLMYIDRGPELPEMIVNRNHLLAVIPIEIEEPQE
jgi:hypothetical protein